MKGLSLPAVLRNRDFDLYWSGVVFSQVGTRAAVAANLYQVYEQDLKQFALIQMNMGREVTRRLREADNQLFARMGPDADMSMFSWPDEDAPLPPGAWRLPRWSA